MYSKIIIDYPFKNDYINHSKADNKIDFGCMEGSWNKDEHAWEGGLVAYRGSINLNQDWILQFDWKYISGGSYDWNHIFSFGTHNYYGGDSSYYAIYDQGLRDGTSIMHVSRDSSKYHTYKAIYDSTNKLLYGYDNNILVNTQNVSLGITSGLYFNGSGNGYRMNAYLKNVIFVFGSNKILPPDHNLIYINIKIS